MHGSKNVKLNVIKEYYTNSVRFTSLIGFNLRNYGTIVVIKYKRPIFMRSPKRLPAGALALFKKG